MRVALAGLLLLALLPGHLDAAPLDWAVSGGHFYTQTAGGEAGFLVAEPFLGELRARGGPTALGYPISYPFEWRGTTVQAFQKAVLQWQPAERRVAHLNVFDDMASGGHDPWLKAVRSTPGHAWLEGEDGMAWPEIVRARQGFLALNRAIEARYFSVRDPMTLYGLPSSRIEDMGNHYAVRLQRAVIQQWKVDVPWARAGETTVANGGDIAKEAGLWPADALRPRDPNGGAWAVATAIAPALPPTPVAVPVQSAPFRAPPIATVPPPGAARRVVIDAGHGGAQIGSSAVMPDGSRLFEKDLNLDIARRVVRLLREAGYDVVATRDGDHQVVAPVLREDLQARIDIANSFRADVFVSIHHNGIASASTRGTEVYYGAERELGAENRALADHIYLQIGRHLNAAGYEPPARGIRPDSTLGGDHLFLLSPASHKVARPSLMPAAIGEALYMTNPVEAAQLARDEVRQAIARAYAVAIGTFLAGRAPLFPG